MFFIMGISSAQKKLDFVQTMLCSRCSQFGRYEIFLTYTYLSLFFIPVFKWNKKYYVKASCCQTLYTIDKELGKRISKGEQVTLREQDLNQVNNGNTYTETHKCPHCGFVTEPGFLYCPKCGSRL